jgi:predicted HD superfamily hydrolase involved in NAD metabolism
MTKNSEATYASAAARKYAEDYLGGGLLEHTLGCARASVELAHRFGLDEEKIATASYLHDIAKRFDIERQIELAREMGMSQAEIDYYPLAVLHGPLAALIARDKLGVDDADVLQAISAHSTGCAGMSSIATVVFIADYTEAGRSFPGSGDLRSKSNLTLNEYAVAILRSKLEYLIDHDRVIDPRAMEFWNELMST